jgi:hypothetical protein
MPEGFDAATMKMLDTCRTGTVKWLLAGGDEVEALAEPRDADDKEYTSIKYVAPPGKAFVCFKSITEGSLEGYSKLRFEARTQEAAMMVIGAEEADGSRYMNISMLPGGEEWTTVEVPFAFWNREPDSPAGNGQLDPESIVRLGTVDGTSILQNVISANKWEIRNVMVAKE